MNEACEVIRVLHVITGLNVGGAERMLHKLSAHADKQYFEFQVLSLLQGGKIALDLRASGVLVHEMGVKGPVSGIIALAQLFRLIRSFRPDVIQGWMYHGNLVAWIAYCFAGCRIPLVWNIRQSLYDLAREKSGTAVVIRFCAAISGSVNRILYNSHTARLHHELIGYSARRGEVIPNGFDPEVFCPDPVARNDIRGQLGVQDNSLLVGLVARFDPLKDHLNFLRAASRVVQAFPNARFLLVGRDVNWENSALIEEVHALGLADRLYLLGERHDIPAVTAAFDVAVSSSVSEAFANAIGEAMSCGVPCVVTDVGDSARILGHCGIVVAKSNPEKLALAIEKLLLLTPESRRESGDCGRQRILNEFSIQSVVGCFERLYVELSKRN